MNYAKAKQECTANHDVYQQCPYCGWTRPGCDHRFSDDIHIHFVTEFESDLEKAITDDSLRQDLEQRLEAFSQYWAEKALEELSSNCDHRFSVVVEKQDVGIIESIDDDLMRMYQMKIWGRGRKVGWKATKLACERCGEVKEL